MFRGRGRGRSSYRSSHHYNHRHSYSSSGYNYNTASRRGGTVSIAASAAHQPQQPQRQLHQQRHNIRKQILRAAHLKAKLSNRRHGSKTALNTRQANKPTSTPKKPCSLFNRAGTCPNGEKCTFEHNPERVAICPKFLRSSCEDPHCLLVHECDPRKTPVCLFFLKGQCSNEACKYLHVKVSADTKVCKDFVDGLCPRGTECNFLHVFSAVARLSTGLSAAAPARVPAAPSRTLSSAGTNSDDFISETQMREDVVDEEGSTLFLALPPRSAEQLIDEVEPQTTNSSGSESSSESTSAVKKSTFPLLFHFSQKLTSLFDTTGLSKDMRGTYGYAEGTYLREMELQKQKSVHKQRLKAIRTRKAGSGTIDNTPPRTLSSTSLQFNPRKQNQKKQELVTIERKNKILLQRIGKILTAPAHISVNKFAERNNSKHARILMARAAKEAAIQNKNEVFYSRLKSLKSYYNIEEWENDYKRLKAVQESVMRQGRFRKSKDKPATSPEQGSESLAPSQPPLDLQTTEIRSFSRSEAAHVRRVKSVKDRRRSSASVKSMRSYQRHEHDETLDEESDEDSHATSVANGNNEQPRLLLQKQKSFSFLNEAMESVRLASTVTISANPENTALLVEIQFHGSENVSRWVELAGLGVDARSDTELEEVCEQLLQSMAIEKAEEGFAIQFHEPSTNSYEEYSNDEDEYSDDAVDEIQPKTFWARRLLCYYGDERRAHARIQAVSAFVVGCTDVDCLMGQCTVTVYVAYCARFKALEGRRFSTSIKLPTVACADPDLMHEFRQNLLRSLSMQYVVPTQSCTLQLRM